MLGAVRQAAGTVRRKELRRPRRRRLPSSEFACASLSRCPASLSHAGPSRFNSLSFVTCDCLVGIQGQEMRRQELAPGGSSGLGDRSRGGGRTAGSAGRSLRWRRGPGSIAGHAQRQGLRVRRWPLPLPEAEGRAGHHVALLPSRPLPPTSPGSFLQKRRGQARAKRARLEGRQRAR